VIEESVPAMPSADFPARAVVLAIDDNPSVLQALEFHLPRAGYAVVTATDGAAGLRLASEREVHLVLLDIDMPQMSGIAVCQAFRADPKLCRLPVVMMTGRPMSAAVSLALAAGARSVLAKPFDLPLLYETLAAQLSDGPRGRAERGK
jgi:CheY-like chemotaxis protein